jgi:CheY-like chemotaxis protein
VAHLAASKSLTVRTDVAETVVEVRSMSHVRINLANVTTLIVDNDHFTRALVAQMLRAFGMASPAMADTGKQAQSYLAHHCVDLCICEAVLPDMNAGELIKWIRRQEASPVRFIPTIVLTGYTQPSIVANARDAGANIVISKPVSPRTLYDHIAWAAKSQRPFVEVGRYVGPDRRFKGDEPPKGDERRSRATSDDSDDEFNAEPVGIAQNGQPA